MAVMQGLLDTPGGEERVVLKRVKARVQVRMPLQCVDPLLTPCAVGRMCSSMHAPVLAGNIMLLCESRLTDK